MSKRFTVIVLDSVGIGEMPDADKFSDKGSNTLGNIAKYIGGLKLENMEKMGLGKIEPILGIEDVENPIASYGKMAEASNAKDTTSGHWEMMGIISEKPFPVYPDGFPDEIINEFIKQTGVGGILGNKPASGTVIINELGDKHVKTGYPIVYTSADSVFQIAAHEEVIPVDKLYQMCEIARKILTGEHAVGRVIARPFIGKGNGNYKRTQRRRDFSLQPPKETILDVLKDKGFDVIAVGKIEDIFAHRGITKADHTTNNKAGILSTIKFLKQEFNGLLFVNLVDFDMLYGHRNDPVGYANALKEFDSYIPQILSQLKGDDVLVITADHGCDPTTKSTDHSREYVPLLVYSPNGKANSLGVRKTFSDIADSIREYFKVEYKNQGTSFIKDIF